ncbi:hypothetical protein BJ741DRAFT_600236 [Chytriomyces cf. hyalinus JEL632]|nr:hypothetical protein BJ741DRAFT_600236 [Chytriomyces cf. hyalinus JEL632]
MRNFRLLLLGGTLFIALTLLSFGILQKSEPSHPPYAGVPPNSEPKPRPIKPSINQTTTPTAEGTFPNIAVVLKTGSETLIDRVAIQLATFLNRIENLLVVGDKPGFAICDYEMVDVYSQLYVDTRKRMGLKLDGSQDDLAGNEVDRRWDELAFERRDRVVTDAHKNLPVFKLLFEKYPDADWFLMIDDDSYVYWDNLAEYLKGKDPSKPYYTGQITISRLNVYQQGCDGIKEFGIGILIAQGGAGILASRGAMKLLLNVVDTCIIKYKDCWAGDIRTALCFRDAGVLVDWGVGFHGVPPNEEFIYPDDPCEKPSVFHHVLPWQMQKLYETGLWDKQLNPKMGTTMGSIYTAFHGTKTVFQVDLDRKGGEYRHFKSSSGKASESLCEGDRKCVAWVFDTDKICWLKSSPRVAEKRKGVSSGVIGGRYKCSKR